MENPFTLKIGQVMTGFGVGCGVGIGVGTPLNLGAVPGVDQVMSATRGATVAFSGVGRQVNSTFNKMGIKGVQAGVGCGVGFGHGFGAGLAIKPGAVHRMQTCLGEALLTIMKKLNIVPDLSIIGKLSLKDAVGPTMKATPKSVEKSALNPIQIASQSAASVYQNPLGKTVEMESKKSQRIEKAPKDAGGTTSESVEKLQTENRILQLLLRHQEILERLEDDNLMIQRVLTEELNIPPQKLHRNEHVDSSKSSTHDCFECRRRSRRRTK